MTQIKKTLSIAGIIALVTMPVMADIASTDYVQNIVNSIPQPAAATDSAAGLTKLYTGVGTNTDGTMTQAAIKTELDKKLENAATTTGSFIIGNGTSTSPNSIMIGNNARISLDEEYGSGDGSIAIGTGARVYEEEGTAPIAIGKNARADIVGVAIGAGAVAAGDHDLGSSVAIGPGASANESSMAIGLEAEALGQSSVAIGLGSNADGDDSLAIGYGAEATAIKAIQLGMGTNNTANTFSVGLGQWNSVTRKYENYTLLKSDGKIPEERLPDSILINDASYNANNSLGIHGTANGDNSIAILGYTGNSDDSIAIGEGATAVADNSIQLGNGYTNTPYTLSVGLGEMDGGASYISYTLLRQGGTIPAGRLTAGSFDEEDYFYENNGVSGQLLQTNGDGTMSWVDATASVLPELINDCKVSGQRCVLITTWNSTTNKPEYTWEVVKVNNN